MNNLKVIVVCGYPKTGKNTMVECLSLMAKQFPVQLLRVSLLEPLFKMCKKFYDLEDDSFSQNKKNVVNVKYGKTPMQLAKELSNYYKNVHGNNFFYVNALQKISEFHKNSIPGKDCMVVVTGCETVEDVYAFEKVYNDLFVYIVCDPFGQSWFSSSNDINEITEKFNCERIVNDGTVVDLLSKVLNIFYTLDSEKASLEVTQFVLHNQTEEKDWHCDR